MITGWWRGERGTGTVPRSCGCRIPEQQCRTSPRTAAVLSLNGIEPALKPGGWPNDSMCLRLDLRRRSGYLPAGHVIPGGAAEGVPRDGQRAGHVHRDDGHPDIVGASAELRRDLRRGDRRIGRISEGALEVRADHSPGTPPAAAPTSQRTWSTRCSAGAARSRPSMARDGSWHRSCAGSRATNCMR